MKLTLSLTTLLLFSIFLSAQDFTVRMKDQDGKTAIHYVSRNAVRNVSSNPVETDVIYRLDRGTIIRLNHQDKTYTEITLAQARHHLAVVLHEEGTAPLILPATHGRCALTYPLRRNDRKIDGSRP